MLYWKHPSTGMAVRERLSSYRETKKKYEVLSNMELNMGNSMPVFQMQLEEKIKILEKRWLESYSVNRLCLDWSYQTVFVKTKNESCCILV